MLNIAVSFVGAVMSFFTFYRWIFDQNVFYKDHSLQLFMWMWFYASTLVMVIFTANQVTSEVSIHSLQ